MGKDANFATFFENSPILVFSADECGANINDYCSLDSLGQKPVSQMTLGEKEQAFLEAMSVSL